MKALRQQNVDSYNSMLEMEYLTDDNKISWEKRIMALDAEIEIISKHDEAYIQRLIKENEAYSLDNLKGFV